MTVTVIVTATIIQQLQEEESLGEWMDTDMDPSSLINIPIYYYRFVIRTNKIIYNNQQQQQEEKERGKECY